jgi:hypothetical protein
MDTETLRTIITIKEIIHTMQSQGESRGRIVDTLCSRGVDRTVSTLMVCGYDPIYAKGTSGHRSITLHCWDSDYFGKLSIGSFCSIAPNISIYLGGNHRVDYVTTYSYLEGGNLKEHLCKPKNVTIGHDVWLASNCTIMSGVTIGDGAVVANNSHVVRDVKPYEMVGGNPARLIRQRFNDQQVAALLELKWWDLPPESIRQVAPFLYSDNVDLAIKKIAELRAT